MRKRWLYAGVPLLGLGLFLSLRHPKAARGDEAPLGTEGKMEEISLSKRMFRPSVEKDPNYLPKLGGMDLTKLRIDGPNVVTELGDKTRVLLTLDANLQKTAMSLLSAYAIQRQDTYSHMRATWRASPRAT
jgi:hypothetical protein